MQGVQKCCVFSEIFLPFFSSRKNEFFPSQHGMESMGTCEGGILCRGSNLGEDFND